MLHETLNVVVPYEKAGVKKHPHVPTLTTYVTTPIHPEKKKAIIICPGGAYMHVSQREGEPVAKQFLAMGFQTFVLDYSISPDVWPTSILELAQAVHMVRERAEEWSIDPDKIIVCGFSAGGHLAASLSCFWNQSFIYSPLGLTAEEIRPNGTILAYPVITSGPFAHRGSFDYVLEGVSDEWLKQYAPACPASSMLELLSLEHQAGAQNPPVFLWHTGTDTCVPVENSLFLAMALRKAGVSFEMHIFPEGPHGISLATEETADAPDQIVPAAQEWVHLAGRWAKDL